MAWLNILFCDTANKRNYDIKEIMGKSDFSEFTMFDTSGRNKATQLIESRQLLSLMIVGYDPDKIEDGKEALDFIKKYSNIPSIFLYLGDHEEILRDAKNHATITLYKDEIHYELNKAIATIIKNK